METFLAEVSDLTNVNGRTRMLFAVLNLIVTEQLSCVRKATPPRSLQN